MLLFLLFVLNLSVPLQVEDLREELGRICVVAQDT